MAAALLTLLDLDAQMSDIRYLVKGVIPACSVGTIFGGSGSGKTFLSLDLALHLSWGLPYLGLKTERTQVVYFAAEGGLGISNRIKAWHKERGLDWSLCDMRVIVAAIPLNIEAPSIVKLIKQAGIVPGCIFVDTFSQSFSGDENSASDVASYFRILTDQFIHNFKCSVIVIHHTGHSNTERPRGSYTFIGNSEFMFGVFRNDSGNIVVLECQKQKDGSLLPPVSFRLDHVTLGKDADGDPITSLCAHHIANPAALAAAVEKGPDGLKKSLLDIAELGLPFAEARRRFNAANPTEKKANVYKDWQRTLAWAKEAGLVTDAESMLRRVKIPDVQ